MSDTASPASAAVGKPILHAHAACEPHPENLVPITSDSCELPGNSRSVMSETAREGAVAAVVLPGLPPLPLLPPPPVPHLPSPPVPRLPPPPLPSHPLLPTEQHKFTHDRNTAEAGSKMSTCETVSGRADRAQHATSSNCGQTRVQEGLSKSTKSSGGLTRDERITLHLEECSDGNVRRTFRSPTASKGATHCDPANTCSRQMKRPLHKKGLADDTTKGSVPGHSKSQRRVITDPVERDCVAPQVVPCSSRGNVSSGPDMEQLEVPVSSTPYPLLPRPAGPSNQFGQPLSPQPPESIVSVQHVYVCVYVCVCVYMRWFA